MAAYTHTPRHESVVDEIEADDRLDSFSVYEDDREAYLTVWDADVREDVRTDYSTFYNVDISTRGLNICVEW